MKKLFLILVIFSFFLQNANGTNLCEVFQQALLFDPTYQQAVFQALSDGENLSLSRSYLFPHISFKTVPEMIKSHSSGGLVRSGLIPPANNNRSLYFDLKLTQTLFDFAKFMNISENKLSAKQAAAKLNAAFQNLILRVTQAYFVILQDEENLAYSEAYKNTLLTEYEQAGEFYKIGSKTKADMYAARSAYAAASSSYISARTQLAIDLEFLRTITGICYSHLDKIGDNFPLVTPKPECVEDWVIKSQKQNWSVIADEYAVQVARDDIKKHFAGYLPTLNLETNYEIRHSKSTNSSILYNTAPTRISDANVFLELDVPLFSGGYTTSLTKQAKYNYQLAFQKLVYSLQNTSFSVRENYFLIFSHLQKLVDDKVTIQSASIAFKNYQERYHEGAGSLLDLLTQQQKLVQAKQQYSADKYEYLKSLFALKNAVGTLSIADIEMMSAYSVKSI